MTDDNSNATPLNPWALSILWPVRMLIRYLLEEERPWWWSEVHPPCCFYLPSHIYVPLHTLTPLHCERHRTTRFRYTLLQNNKLSLIGLYVKTPHMCNLRYGIVQFTKSFRKKIIAVMSSNASYPRSSLRVYSTGKPNIFCLISYRTHLRFNICDFYTEPV